uniref:uncharacterized protein LOC122607174 n=1 Tax=Erigeron canadensis TaxID=72917 RepID=UPI001CB9C0AE|nr:uncharacterized protein LOC122607174 [Erigeron canadensis]
MRKGNLFVEDDTNSFPVPLPVATKHGGPPAAAYNKRHNVEAPSTPGRPVFSFSINNNNGPSKKLVPCSSSSKWNDAEKWLVVSHEKNHHHHHHLINGFVKQSADFVSRKSTTSNHQITSPQQKVSTFQDHHHNLTASDSCFNVVKDKFTNELDQEPNLLMKVPADECLEPLSESFLFKEEAASRDIGTEMTPLGSSTTSRCPTPFKTMSPPRHNTPATRSGPMDMGAELLIQDSCHLAKLRLAETPFESSNWSTREEEEEDLSKSLRHFEMNYQCRKSISESGDLAWEQEEKTKCCLRYQREKANIQAWVDLQNAKAEAESRKLEVKVQKMRSKFEEKMMRKMADVHRKAEELRAAAQLEHTEQLHKAKEQANKTKRHLNVQYSGCSCSCFPCNINFHNSN